MNKGFTLLEVLLAVAISAIVLTVAYGSFFQIIKSKDFAESHLEMYHEARVIMSKLISDLSVAYPHGRIYSEDSKVEPLFFEGRRNGDMSSVRFTSFSRLPGVNAMSSDQTEIEYYLREDRETGLFHLMRSENPSIGYEDGGIEYALSERVAEFELMYMSSSEDTNSLSEWDSRSTGKIPRGVEIRFVLKNESGEEIEFSTFIVLPLAR